MASARILGRDTVLKGDWISECGRAGYWISQTSTSTLTAIPSWLTITLESELGWFSDSNDTNLQSPDGSGYLSRVARAAANTAGAIVSFRFVADRPCVISTYFGGFNNVVREGSLTWLDMDGLTLDAVSESHTSGLWSRAVIDGEVRLRIVQLANPAFYVSGLFFDPWLPSSTGLSQGFFGHTVT